MNDRTLREIFFDAHKHYQENPRHGIGCACMDELVREIRRQIPDSFLMPKAHDWALLVFSNLQRTR